MPNTRRRVQPGATGRNSERSLNEALTRVLRTKNPRWVDALGAEQHRKLQDRGQPDILLQSPGAPPVILETEFGLAATVETDALKRLGARLRDGGAEVETVLAVRIPEALAECRQADVDIAAAEAVYEYAVLRSSGKPDGEPQRQPTKGWLTADIDELTAVIEACEISESRLAKTLETLERGVDDSAAVLNEEDAAKPAVNAKIGAALHQEPGEQTSGMAAAILANALSFQAGIAGTHGVRTAAEMRDTHGKMGKAAVDAEWRKILDINYWPIFDIARQVLEPIPDRKAARILEILAVTAGDLETHGVTKSHDLHGRVFQRMISDRKFLATFYTLPESAALLAELAVGMLDIDWSDENRVKRLKIADLACGTGTLITAAYQAAAGRMRRAGLDDRALHPAMMENALIAVDIMPAATHLTTTMLAGRHPSVPFRDTHVWQMPYGPLEEGGPPMLGALDLVAQEYSRDLFSETRARYRAGHRKSGDSADQKSDAEIRVGRLIADGGMDLVIMNPPFTRPTNHEATDRPVPSFAGMNTADEEQKAMSARLRTLRNRKRNPVGNGNAGLASYFIDIADKKIKRGGVIAMVLPQAFVAGSSWSDARQRIEEDYTDIGIASLSGTEGRNAERSWSADTGMGEILLTARRRQTGMAAKKPNPIKAVVLKERPGDAAAALASAKAVRKASETKCRHLRLGDDEIGLTAQGGWPTVVGTIGTLSTRICTAMSGLAAGELPMPRSGSGHAVPIAKLGELGNRGLVHRDINGSGGRGPFNIVPCENAAERTFPALWKHKAANERRVVVEPDSEAVQRPRMESAAENVWKTASRFHINQEFRLNSQSLAACITDEPALGGPAWPNFTPLDLGDEETLTLWFNTTPGLMLFWWTANRQQAGRARTTISRITNLPVLDTRKMTKEKKHGAVKLLAKFRKMALLPANEAYRDPVRRELDHSFLGGVLQLADDALKEVDGLRTVWCREPSVHGGKATKP